MGVRFGPARNSCNGEMNWTKSCPLLTETSCPCESIQFLFLLLWFCQSLQADQRRMVVGKRGRKDVREGWVLPRRSGKKAQICEHIVTMKKVSTHATYRKGLNCMWRMKRVREKLRRHGMKPVGGWSKANQLKGTLFATGKEVGFLTNKIVKDVLWLVYHKYKPTHAQLKKIKSTFSFAWQLRTGEVNGNWPCMEKTKKLLAPIGLSPRTQFNSEATKWLAPDQIQTIFTTPWRPGDQEMPLPRYSVSLLMCYDWLMNGCRPVGLDQKIKKSKTHHLDEEHGYLYTQMLGGRAKQEQRMGPRQWKAYRVCTCAGPRHRGLPDDYVETYMLFNDDGTPRVPITWTTECPLTCYQTLMHFYTRCGQPDNQRLYPRWSNKRNRLGENIGRDTMFETELMPFINFQGANPGGIVYDFNGGRKANGRLCDHFNIPYPFSMDWHGDKAKWWKVYQPNVKLPAGFKRREQSTNPLNAIRGHLEIIKHWGRGRLAVRPKPALPPKNSPQPPQLPPMPFPMPMMQMMSMLPPPVFMPPMIPKRTGVNYSKFEAKMDLLLKKMGCEVELTEIENKYS